MDVRNVTGSALKGLGGKAGVLRPPFRSQFPWARARNTDSPLGKVTFKRYTDRTSRVSVGPSRNRCLRGAPKPWSERSRTRTSGGRQETAESGKPITGDATGRIRQRKKLLPSLIIPTGALINRMGYPRGAGKLVAEVRRSADRLK